MKNLTEKKTYIFRKGPAVEKMELSEQLSPSIVGSWRIVQYRVTQGEDEKPRWKEVWTFAAMNEEETNGVYVCDYINLYSIIGKWELSDKVIRLIRDEQVCEYAVEELSTDILRLKSIDENEYISAISFVRAE